MKCEGVKVKGEGRRVKVRDINIGLNMIAGALVRDVSYKRVN